MDFVTTLVLIVDIVAALAVIVLVLMQHGKGADMGAAFGSGSAGSVFGSAGSANFLSRSTAACATVFFAASLGLVLLTAPSKSEKSSLGVMSSAKPAATASAAAASQADNKKIPD